MITGWWLAAALFIIVLYLAFRYRRLKNQFRRVKMEMARLNSTLASVRHELTEIKNRRKRSFAAATEALITVENDYTISNTNKVARQLFGRPTKGISLMAWTRQYRLQELVEETMNGQKMPPVHFNLGDRSLVARARFVKQKKEVVAVALAINDVTELQYLTRARRDFVANISHELRNPLASIQLLAETLLNGAIDNKAMAGQLINKIAAQADSLNQLAQELLDLSMIESGQAPLKMGPHPLQAIANTQVDRMRPQARRKNIVLGVDVADDVAVLVDETMIGRVISNLLHNAIKFTESGQVTVSAVNNGDDTSLVDRIVAGEWVTVCVSDTGIGIPKHEIDRIFERFYVTDRARSRKKSGTGLGLAIAKHIVEAHGGRIWAKSDGRSGTTFYFTLPMEEERVPSQESNPA